MSNDQKINYLEMPARDLKLAEKFYSENFGWTFTWYGDEYLAFNDGKTDGGFFKSDLHSSTENGATLIVLYAEDLEATMEKVLGNGATLVKDIISFPGGRRFQFADPNGNELAVWSDK